jgi:hypothetical protein
MFQIDSVVVVDSTARHGVHLADLEELASSEVPVDVLLDVIGLQRQRRVPFAVEGGPA